MARKKKVQVEERAEVVPGKIKKKGRRSLIFGLILIILFVSLLVLVPILLFQIGLVKNPFTNLHIEPREFNVVDECSMIVGNLIHSIQDEGVCEQRCKIDCDVRGLFFYDSEFSESPNDCHKCRCFCR